MGDIRQTRRRGVRTDPDIAEAARRLAQSGQAWTAAGIHRRLLEDHPEWKARMPEVRTIQNLVRGLTGLPGEPWSFSAEAEPEDGGLVLRVLGELWDAGVWPRPLTNEEAGHIVRLRRAFPDLDAVRSLSLARMYLMAADANQRRHHIFTATDLDQYLAFAPWRDGAVRYIDAFRERRVLVYVNQPGDPSSSEVRAILRGPKETLEETAARVAADVKAGLNPFLDGRPYRKDSEE